MSEPRYAIGIDLGTTHCALSYVDLHASEGERVSQHVLPIPQLTAPGSIEERSLLPSFLYLPHASERAPGDLTLPWRDDLAYAVGTLARERGAQTPVRLVSSAKSWLCHAGVDRRGAILPADAPADVERVSPLTATTRYLEHLRDAWNFRQRDAPPGRTGGDHHHSGLVRFGRARADGRSGADRGAGAHKLARRAASGAV